MREATECYEEIKRQVYNGVILEGRIEEIVEKHMLKREMRIVNSLENLSTILHRCEVELGLNFPEDEEMAWEEATAIIQVHYTALRRTK